MASQGEVTTRPSGNAGARAFYLLVALGVLAPLLNPFVGVPLDLAVAVWAHRHGQKLARNVLLAIAVVAALWVALGFGSGTRGAV